MPPRSRDSRSGPREDGASPARDGSRARPARGGGRDAAMRSLQRAAGNRALQRLLPDGDVQARLEVGPASDRHEQEADRVAREIASMVLMRSPATGSPPLAGPGTPASAAQHFVKVSRRPVQPAAAPVVGLAGGPAGADVESQIRTAGGGSPLPVAFRSDMEGAFGTDLAGVRVHDDTRAGDLNRALGADAFTTGDHIFFGAGRFDPGSSRGRELAAHELTHVVQQRGGTPDAAIGRSGVVHRHSSFEHYLLGQVAPGKLANIPLVRQAKELNDRITKLEHAFGGVSDPDALQKARDDYDALRMDENFVDALHTIKQEMDRLAEWASKPDERAKGADVKTGMVEQIDGEWQVPYINVPCRDGSVVVSYSEMNTLPDMFGNPETMMKLPREKLLSILQGVRMQTFNELDNLWKEVSTGVKLPESLKGEPTGSFRSKLKGYLWDTTFEGAKGGKAERWTGPKYAERGELAINKVSKYEGQEESEQYFAAVERNACHFAPASWNAWQDYHTQAREFAAKSVEAREAGKDAEAKNLANRALLFNGFGDHYLQDSFAAGHLVNKTKIMQWFTAWMAGKGSSLGVFQKASTEWRMAVMIANQQALQEDPQLLDDAKTRGNLQPKQGQTGSESLDQLAAEMGLTPGPAVTFMMWWRHQAVKQSSKQTMTADQAAAGYGIDAKLAASLMQQIVGLGFASATTTKILGFGKPAFELDMAIIRTALKKGMTRREAAYEATLAQQAGPEGEHDYKAEAIEFNFAALNAFLSNGVIQAASGYFHDKYCKEGLVVQAGNGTRLNRIYGDSNMLKAGGQVGVLYSAETSKLSREAIFNLLQGDENDTPIPSVSTIRDRFPATVIDGDNTLSLADWWNQLKASGEAGEFEKATNNSARYLMRPVMGGLSSGNALDVDAIIGQAQGTLPKPPGPHDEGPW